MKENTWTEQRWSDEAIFAAMRDALDEVPGYYLTAKNYADLVTRGRVTGPSLPRIVQRFRTWRKACKAAGVPCGEIGRKPGIVEWTDEQLLDWLFRFMNTHGDDATYTEFEEWLRANGGPSGQTVRNRLGPKWSDLKKQTIF